MLLLKFSFSVSSRVKSRCYDDPLCSWRRFQEKCECYQSPCDTHHCQLNQDEPLCNCTKHLCDWDATKGLGACQFIRNERDEFCSCRRDFEYPLYNPNGMIKCSTVLVDNFSLPCYKTNFVRNIL
ncbi:uncharacterized protein NPIL_245571 [Nephila pilipes]|uniref:Uncharacterized protein n=1 Tax=Nephila pilipes TaxID=299642 RepID=A0A8X6UKE9_NEPPI|nr:uncharacterized protein NPIL_245571 [Nephila pilipes]